MRLAICDNDQAEIDQRIQMIEEISAAKNIEPEILVFRSIPQLLFEMEEIAPSVDLLLLNIDWPPGVEGLRAAHKLRTELHYEGEIIFISDSDQYAIYAFDVRTFHYIVKNVTSPTRQKTILEAAIDYCDQKQQKFLLLKGANEYKNIPIASIIYVEAKGRMLCVHYQENSAEVTFDFTSTFEQLEHRLLPYGFIRVHRSYLIARKQIVSFSYDEIQLKTGAVIPIGRKYLLSLKKSLGNTKE